jgi:hypothetical protein
MMSFSQVFLLAAVSVCVVIGLNVDAQPHVEHRQKSGFHHAMNG